MHTVTVLTAPDRADLEPAAVGRLAQQWQGGPVRWLHERVAAQFSVPGVPADRDRVWLHWQQEGHDLVVQAGPPRHARVLLADLDSTMIQQECIDELAAQAGVGEQVAAITARAMNGELDFTGALHERVALLAGLPVRVIEQVLRQRISLAPGARELVATMRAHGAHCALVSGGFTQFTAPVATQLGFHEHRANTLAVEDGHLAGTVVPPVVGQQAKVAALRSITARLGVAPAEVVAVGDGANDLPMLHLAGTGVALHAKASVSAVCDVRVEHGDLTSLLYLQGYAVEELVTVA